MSSTSRVSWVTPIFLRILFVPCQFNLIRINNYYKITQICTEFTWTFRRHSKPQDIVTTITIRCVLLLINFIMANGAEQSQSSPLIDSCWHKFTLTSLMSSCVVLTVRHWFAFLISIKRCLQVSLFKSPMFFTKNESNKSLKWPSTIPGCPQNGS